MKDIGLQVSVSSHHASLWSLLVGLFPAHPYRGITRDPAHPRGISQEAEDEPIFQNEDELEMYIRSFRE
ncbi:MAG: hypothetical protein U1F66_01490 [bacterium]